MTTTSGATLPLTTTFTPPADCLTSITSTITDNGLRLGYNSTCIPSGAQTADRSYAFSPALNCPYSYTTAAITRLSLGTVTETRAICCPVLDGIGALSGITVQTNSDTTGRDWYSTLGCTAAFNSGGFLTIWDEGFLISDSFSSGQGLNAYSVQIAWQSTDLPTTSTTSTTSTISASTTSAIPSSTASTVPPVPDVPSNSLSTGSKIAIGITVPLALIGLAIAVLILMRRRQRRRSFNEQKHFNGRDNSSYVGPGILLREDFSTNGNESGNS